MHILGTYTERKFLQRGRDIPLIQKRGRVLHFVLSCMRTVVNRGYKRWEEALVGVGDSMISW
jgi:hypothetical protein